MTERRQRILILAVAVVLLAVVVMTLVTDRVALPLPLAIPEEGAARADAAVVAASPAVAPPIEREEAPPTMATSIPPTTKREDAVPTRVFSVRDLVLGKDAVASAVDLGEILRQATDAAYWEEPGRSLVVEGSGVLGVTADPEMQRRVASLLADVRRSPPARR